MKKKLTSFVLIFLFLSFLLKAQPGTKHILLEEFSTAPCGFCPEGDLIASQIIDAHPEVIWVTHHAGFGTDSMTVPENSTIANAFTTFAPGACIDRGDYPIPVYTMPPYIAVSRQKWDSIAVAHLNDPPVVDVLLTNSFNASSLKLDCSVDINFITTPGSGDIRLNLFLVEDSVVGFGSGYDQTNYFNTTFGHAFYNLGDPMVGYVHHHVIRKIVTGAWGLTGIIPANPIAGNSFTHVFTNIDISSNWKVQDLSIVAFVSYYNADAHLRQVINSNEQSFSVSASVSNTSERQSGITVFPNPAENNLCVEFENAQFSSNNTGVIYNLTGQKMFALDWKSLATGKQKTIDISACPPGIYFLELKSNSGTFRKSFVKI